MRLCIGRTSRFGGGHRHRHRGEPLLYALEHSLCDLRVRFLDGVAKSERVRTAVTLDYDALESDQGRSVVPPRIDAVPEGFERGQREQCERLAQRVARELLAKEIREHSGEALGGLQYDVAD